ncbi:MULTISPECIES: hydrogenase nickel incorporation protein HypB [Pseudofrankia]|uniref:hydrogenase nickel incorporation protein HypB n=1 Tax=Pseudofrankia TaxID=2994363 RepID=UPI000234D6B5|nr:hydrogenase nickel incorporation protein HypB [Pseudofrankia sp. EUN1h]OHV41557.1 hydrogenase accessory protein HypB [Pseudofrankia sp. EUN1h]
MCVTCGCDGDAQPRIIGPVDPVRRDNEPVRRDRDDIRLVTLEERILAKNDTLAASNRHWLAHQGILAVNIMSSPGAGKTTLLERTIRELNVEWPIAVVEGDQEGVLDADRIRASGAPVVQVNTGDGCHLDAEMFDRGLRALPLTPGQLIFVENVGNLVCPALFDLGEGARVVVTAVTEGEDKPAKYPRMFASADLVLINKCDLLPHVDFDVAACERRIRLASPRAEVMTVSARTGEGLSAWYGWLRHQRGHREAEASACSTHHHHHPSADPADALSGSAPVESSAL